MYKYDEIKTVHLEMTDNCNAACPMCARNINGGQDNPQLPGTELFIDDIKKIFNVDFINDMKLRTSYGKTGSANFSDFQYATFFTSGSFY
jgi:hypothetical protein